LEALRGQAAGYRNTSPNRLFLIFEKGQNYSPNTLTQTSGRLADDLLDLANIGPVMIVSLTIGESCCRRIRGHHLLTGRHQSVAFAPQRQRPGTCINR